MHALRARAGNLEKFNLQELQQYLPKLKQGKTTGPSGISNEFVLEAARHPCGQELLLSYINTALTLGTLNFEALRSLVALVPKASSITQAGSLRPINLLEVLNKLVSGLLIQRLMLSWRRPKRQLGAVPGGQVLEGLASTLFHLQAEDRTDSPGIWVTIDIKGAFDHVRHARLLQFVADITPDGRAREAAMLLTLIHAQQMSFRWMGHSWEVEATTRGIAQGGSHSAQTFSYFIDFLLGEAFERWESVSQKGDHGVAVHR